MVLRGSMPGVVSRPKLRSVAGLALVSTFALAGAARAEMASDLAAEMATEVSSVEINGASEPLSGETSIAVLPTSVQDTPQAVTVVTSAQLKAQGVNTLEGALRNVPGITIAIGEGGALNGDQFKIRGFSAQDDIYVDGLRDFGVYTRDSFAFESVQVLKGPSGALFGRGAVGGAINTVSKRPRLEDTAGLDLFVGSAGYVRGLADLNVRLGDSTALRLNLMAQSSNVVGRDEVFTRRRGAAAGIAFGLGTGTTLTLTYLHQRDERRIDYGIIIVQPPGQITAMPASEFDIGVERSTFTGFLDDRDETTADVITARFAHRFSDSLTLTSDSRAGYYSRYFQYSTFDNCSAACVTALFDNNPATVPLGGYGGGGPYDATSSGAQNLTALRWDSAAWGVKFQLIGGWDISGQRNDKLFYAYTLPAGVTARNLMPRPIVDPDPTFPAGYEVYLPNAANICPVAPARACSATGTTVLRAISRSTDLAAFVNGRVWFSNAVSLIGSARFDRYEASTDSRLVNGAVTPLATRSNLFNPRVSLLWEPSDTSTWYVSWGRSATPQGTSVINVGNVLAVATKDLEPEVSETLEAGAKIGVGPRLSLTLSMFQTTKDNAKQQDPSGSGFLLAQSGERQRITGVEIGLVGQLAPGWTLSVNYTYLGSEILESFTNCSATTLPCAPGSAAATPTLNTHVIGRDIYFAPRNAASLWTTWDIPDTGWQIGGGVTYQDRMFTQYSTTTVGAVTAVTRIATIPRSLSADAFVAYSWDSYRIALNVSNMTDAFSYAQATSNRGVPAAGRTFILSLGAAF